MRTFCYIVSAVAGALTVGACGFKILGTIREHGVGFGPEPQTSLCYLGAMIGLCLILAPFRHGFRAKID